MKAQNMVLSVVAILGFSFTFNKNIVKADSVKINVTDNKSDRQHYYNTTFKDKHEVEEDSDERKDAIKQIQHEAKEAIKEGKLKVKIAREKRLAEIRRKKAEQKAKEERERKALLKDIADTGKDEKVSDNDKLEFDKNGLLKMSSSDTAEEVIDLLCGIPKHKNGQSIHNNGLDDLIDKLSASECVYVLHRIEGKGFGQTGDGVAGYDSHANHELFIQDQINKRFNGSIHNLLKAWGTFEYPGY